QLRESFAQTRRDVIGGRDEAAEDYGVGAGSDERLEDFDRRFELRIGRSGQALGSYHEARERSRFLQAGRRLHIERVDLVGLVAAVRRRGQQEKVPLLVLGQSLQQIEALLAALMRADAGMRFVDHDELWAGPRKRVAASLRLDVVEADDGVRVRIEQRLRGR